MLVLKIFIFPQYCLVCSCLFNVSYGFMACNCTFVRFIYILYVSLLYSCHFFFNIYSNFSFLFSRTKTILFVSYLNNSNNINLKDYVKLCSVKSIQSGFQHIYWIINKNVKHIRHFNRFSKAFYGFEHKHLYVFHPSLDIFILFYFFSKFYLSITWTLCKQILDKNDNNRRK